jgi:hypothetical protein
MPGRGVVSEVGCGLGGNRADMYALGCNLQRSKGSSCSAVGAQAVVCVDVKVVFLAFDNVCKSGICKPEEFTALEKLGIWLSILSIEA